MREIRAIGKLNDPHIVTAHDAGQKDGVYFLAMECLSGVDLSALVRHCGPLRPADACEIVRQAALGLEYVHREGHLHRDIKPSNLMLCADGCVKILDLGLSVLMEEQQDHAAELTATGQPLGTLHYMSPEQAADAHRVDCRSDVYSLGATLFTLISGKAPFHGPEYKSPSSKMMALAVEAPRALTDVRDDVPPEVSDIVARMLAKNADERPATSREVIELLAPFAGDAQLDEVVRLAKDKVQTETDLPPGDTFAHLRNSFSDTHPTIAQEPSTKRGAAAPPIGRIAVALGAAALAGLLLLAVMFTVRTDRGTIIVEVPEGQEKNIQLAVARGGQIVEVLDAGNGWTIRVEEGEYQIDVRKGGDRFEIENNRLTVMHNKNTRVKVILQPASTQGQLAASTLHRPGTNLLPSDGLILHMTFEADTILDKGDHYQVLDLSGKGNHGRAEHMEPSKGYIGGGLLDIGKGGSLVEDFGGLILEDHADFRGGSFAKLTGAVWFKLNVSPWHAYVMKKFQDSNSKDWGIELVSDKLQFWSESNGRDFRRGNLPLNVGRWQHIAFVLNMPSETLRLYHDGELAGEFTNIGHVSEETTARPCFGVWGGITLDELVFYKRCLTDNEIRALVSRVSAAAGETRPEAAKGRSDRDTRTTASRKLVVTLKQSRKGEGYLQKELDPKSPAFLFTVEDIDDKCARIVSRESGMSMGIWGTAMREGEWIVQWPFGERAADHYWRIEPVADGEGDTEPSPAGGASDSRSPAAASHDAQQAAEVQP